MTPEEQAEMDELRAALTVAVRERDELWLTVDRLRAGLDQAHQDLFQYTHTIPDTSVVTYSVLVVRGQMTPAVARVVMGLPGLEVAELDGPPPSLELRSRNAVGDESLTVAATLLPQSRVEQRTIDLGTITAPPPGGGNGGGRP